MNTDGADERRYCRAERSFGKGRSALLSFAFNLRTLRPSAFAVDDKQIPRRWLLGITRRRQSFCGSVDSDAGVARSAVACLTAVATTVPSSSIACMTRS